MTAAKSSNGLASNSARAVAQQLGKLWAKPLIAPRLPVEFLRHGKRQLALVSAINRQFGHASPIGSTHGLAKHGQQGIRFRGVRPHGAYRAFACSCFFRSEE